MDFITEKQRDLLLEAFQELDKSSPVFPSPEEAVMNAAIMLSMPSAVSEGHECYGENGEKDEFLARIIAYRYYSIADYLPNKKPTRKFVTYELVLFLFIDLNFFHEAKLFRYSSTFTYWIPSTSCVLPR